MSHDDVDLVLYVTSPNGAVEGQNEVQRGFEAAEWEIELTLWSIFHNF